MIEYPQHSTAATGGTGTGRTHLLDAVVNGVGFLASQQKEDGRWDGEYGGPMFLLPLYVAGAYVTSQEIPGRERQGMIDYLFHVQNEDGSVGLHSEAPGSMFCTTLSYVSLRILGVPPDDLAAARMREWMHTNGTPLGSASWGKSILALLNLYRYEGVQPVPPELWCLPRFLPFHPGRWWCHTRAVYLPLGYLYAKRACCHETPLIRALRDELYDAPYEEIPFANHRDTLAACDTLVKPSRILLAVNRLLHAYEKRPIKWLRDRALTYVLDHIRYEDRSTGLVNLGPVNAVLNTIVHHFREPGGPEFRAHFEALKDYQFESPAGLMLNGENSTALWDTVFAAQAILATPFRDEHAGTLRRAHDFISNTQILEDPPDARRYFREPSYGAWPFGSRSQGWAVTDCTAEALKSSIYLETMVEQPLTEDRLCAGVRWLLSVQNGDGGWASYEKRRGPAWLEQFNPSHVFADIMVDYSYTECSSASLQALALARQRLRGHFGRELDRAIDRGANFIRGKQRADGSWEGSWGVCFTIGAWYGIQGLRAAGCGQDDPQVCVAANFLLRHQNADGGWGESHESCLQRRYISATPSRSVNTAWALMALVGAGRAGTEAAARAAHYLAALQQPDGDWPREPMTGVFNKTTLIHYDNYRRYFPLRALSEYLHETRKNLNPHR